MPALLRIEDLSVDFISEKTTTQALKNISLEINSGEILALVGESGSGKSVTSLSILQLLAAPPARYTSGKILFSDGAKPDVNLLELSPQKLRPIRGNRIAMIFQEPMTSLNPVLTCGSQVMETLLAHQSVTNKKAKQLTIEWFARVKLPSPEKIFNRYPHELSGGQKQRVMIAMAMCCRPTLLICDEPTTALDVTVQKSILKLIKELQEMSGMGVIFISHDLGVVAEIADRIAVMYKGEIVEQGSVQEIFSSPRHPYTRGLLACRPGNHARGERLPVVSDFLEGDMGSDIIMIGKTEDEKEASLTQDQSEKDRSVLVSVEQLSVWFPARKGFLGRPLEYTKAVDNVTFDIYKGETLGLVGESGCGKTTLGRALLRLVDRKFGKILYKETDIASISNKELRTLRKDIQIVFQDPYSSLNPRMTIGEAIAEPLQVHGIMVGDKNRKQKVMDLLERVDLRPEHFNRYPHEFSGGQRQRIVIARALALNPSFIVCDESVAALDVSVQAQVLNLLNDLKSEFGFTVVFISHDLAVVRYISDRIMVMNRGRIEETGPADRIYFHSQSPYTRKLIESIPTGVIER